MAKTIPLPPETCFNSLDEALAWSDEQSALKSKKDKDIGRKQRALRTYLLSHGPNPKKMEIPSLFPEFDKLRISTSTQDNYRIYVSGVSLSKAYTQGRSTNLCQTTPYFHQTIDYLYDLLMKNGSETNVDSEAEVSEEETIKERYISPITGKEV